MTPRQRHLANVAALKLLRDQVDLQTIEATHGRAAAVAAHTILSDYTGYGDAATLRLAFDGLDRPINELADLHLPTTWIQSIRRSTLDAYYTPIDVGAAMWSIVGDLLPIDHNTTVLEPACGTGVFIRTAPAIIPHVNIAAVECDDVGAGITRTLFPAVKLAHRAFETAARFLPEFDVVIGNVPFGDKIVVETIGHGDELPENCCRTLHDYFTCRAVAQLRRGGVAALITSTGTLGKLRDAARRWLAQHAELVFAARLPVGTFDTTQASADLLVFRRHVSDVLVPSDTWINTSRLSADLADGRPLPVRGAGWAEPLLRDRQLAGVDVNHWFRQHPELGLGEWFAAKGQYGRYDASVRGAGDVAERLTAAWQRWRVVKGLDHSIAPEPLKRAESAVTNSPATTALPPMERAAKRLLDALRRVLAEQSRQESAEASQRLLLGLYEDFRGRFGTVRAVEPRKLHDTELRRAWPLLRLLETADGDRGAVFNSRIVHLTSERRCATVVDALLVVLNERGCVDIDAIAAKMEGN